MKPDVVSLCRTILEEESALPEKHLDGLFGRDEGPLFAPLKKKSLASVKDLLHYEPKSKLPLDAMTDRIICGDSLQVMKAMPDGACDLAVTSPPYNLKNSTGNGMKCGKGGKWQNARLINGYVDHADELPHEDYVAWQRACLTEMMRLLSDDGAIFYNHKWRVQGGLLQDRQDIVAGFPVRQIIIWRRKGGINFNPGYFLPTYEVIYLIAKPDFKLAPKANALGDVWEFTQEMSNPHPAPFPLDLIERIIGATKATRVLDPFMGSGTTAVAARNLDRHFTGIELSEEYAQMAVKRLAGGDWRGENE